MFDLATVALHHGDDYVVSALEECGREACVAALNVVETRDPATTSAIMRQLMVRERTRHLADSAQEMTRSLLQRALTETNSGRAMNTDAAKDDRVPAPPAPADEQGDR